EWICVGRVEDVPQPGDYLARSIATEPIMVVRDAEDDIRAYLNVCRHRGCQIVSSEGGGNDFDIPYPAPASGKTKAFRCPYHGWLYSLNGELRATPEFQETRDFDKREHGLQALRVEIWNNFILVNFDRDAGSFADRVSEMDKWEFYKYDPSGLVTVARF